MSGKMLDCTHDKTTKITKRQYFFPIRLALSVAGQGRWAGGADRRSRNNGHCYKGRLVQLLWQKIAFI